MKRTRSGRYVVYGGMDHPRLGEAREIGIYDTVTARVRRVALPTTCWHLTVHPVLDVCYAVSFRVSPADGTDWRRWGMAYQRQYAFEIDVEAGQVTRHWSGEPDLPVHINSDVTISDSGAHLLHRRQPYCRVHRPGDDGPGEVHRRAPGGP